MTFQRPTLSQLIERVESDVVTGLGLGAALKASVEAVFSRALALLAHGMHGHLDWAARQLFPDTANAEYLDQWAGVWAVSRKQASAASGPVTFTGTESSVVPAGTQLRNEAGAILVTQGPATITSGTATATVEAAEAGAAGNTPADGELAFVSPVGGVGSVATVGAGGITGGADTESDSALRGRVLIRIQQPPAGGAAADYVAWALSVAGVTRAWVRPEWVGPGTVGVLFVLDDNPTDIIPGSPKVDEVQAYLDTVRPVTAKVHALAPVPLVVDLTIELLPNTVAVQEAVEASLVDFFRREAEPGVPIALSTISEAISTTPGESSHVLTSPVADLVPDTAELPILGVITWA